MKKVTLGNQGLHCDKDKARRVQHGNAPHRATPSCTLPWGWLTCLDILND